MWDKLCKVIDYYFLPNTKEMKLKQDESTVKAADSFLDTCKNCKHLTATAAGKLVTQQSVEDFYKEVFKV